MLAAVRHLHIVDISPERVTPPCQMPCVAKDAMPCHDGRALPLFISFSLMMPDTPLAYDAYDLYAPIAMLMLR